MAEGVICWDFDHTLFGFHPTAPDSAHPVQDPLFAGFGLRPGIEPVLERLASWQYTSDITTGASLAYVKRTLEATGATEILRHFQHIFPGDAIALGAGKLYQPAAQAHGLSEDDASMQMIVVGDMYDDEPADLARVVFIRQPNGHLHDPRVVEAVIGALRADGSGHLYAGFLVWHRRAQAQGQQIPNGGLLVTHVDGTAICVAEQPPRPPRRARLGPVRTPTVTLLAWPQRVVG